MGNHCGGSTALGLKPTLASGVVVRTPQKSSLCVHQVHERGIMPFPTIKHTPLPHLPHCLSFAAFAGACGNDKLAQHRSTHTCKLPLQLPACARARALNRTLLARSRLLPASMQLTGLPSKHSPVYCQRASLPGPSDCAQHIRLNLQLNNSQGTAPSNQCKSTATNKS